MPGDEQQLGFPDRLQQAVLAAFDGLGPNLIGDVEGEADHADDLPAFVAVGELVGAHPAVALRGRQLLHDSPLRAPGLDDLPFVPVIVLGVRGTVVRLGPALDVLAPASGHPQNLLVDPQHAVLPILEEDKRGHRIEDHLQFRPLARQFTFRPPAVGGVEQQPMPEDAAVGLPFRSGPAFHPDDPAGRMLHPEEGMPGQKRPGRFPDRFHHVAAVLPVNHLDERTDIGRHGRRFHGEQFFQLRAGVGHLGRAIGAKPKAVDGPRHGQCQFGDPIFGAAKFRLRLGACRGLQLPPTKLAPEDEKQEGPGHPDETHPFHHAEADQHLRVGHQARQQPIRRDDPSQARPDIEQAGSPRDLDKFHS